MRRWAISLFFLLFIVLPVAPAATTQTAIPITTIEHAVFAYGGGSMRVVSDNVRTGTVASQSPVPSLDQVAGFLAAETTAPVVEDTVSLFHQGTLRGGEVSSTRALSTSLSSDLTHYNPAGTLNEFQVPRSVYNQWYRDLLIEPRTDLHLGTGIVTPELRVMPPASGQLNQYLVR